MENQDLDDISKELEASLSDKSLEFSIDIIQNISTSVASAIFENFPWLDYIYKSIKTVSSVQQALFHKKVLNYIAEASQGDIAGRQKIIEEFNNEPSHEDNFGSATLLILDKFESVSKAKYFGRLFKYLANSQILYQEYEIMTNILLHIPIPVLRKIVNEDDEIKSGYDRYARAYDTLLESLGLIEIKRDITNEVRRSLVKQNDVIPPKIVFGSRNNQHPLPTRISNLFSAVLKDKPIVRGPFE